MENTKQKKPIFKKWWFWVIIGLVVVIIIGSSSGGEQEPTAGSGDTNTQTSTDAPAEPTPEVTYEVIDMQTMLDELKENALKAEKTYQDKNVELVGKIDSFDSDGSYICIEPVNADDWNFDTVQCYIKDDAQLNLLLEKKVGDRITVKGKITSIGEVLGYSLKIAEVS